MFIINKKRLRIILYCLILGIFTYVCGTTKIKDNNIAQQTTSIPTSSKVIILDARTWKTR